MKKTFLFMVAVGLIDVAAAFRPPAVPLVSSDPFFSLWDASPTLTSGETEHWTGAKQPLSIIANVDGVDWRLCGWKPEKVQPARQLSVEVLPLTSVYRFAAGSAEITVRFFTPKFTDELEVFSRPVTYVSVQSIGARQVKIRAEIAPAFATHDDSAKMKKVETTIAGLSAYAWERVLQKLFVPCHDRMRCNWGRAWLVNPEAEGLDVRFLLAYDDLQAGEWMGRPLTAWWRRNGQSFADMLTAAVKDYPRLVAKAAAFNRDFMERLVCVGGEKYARLAALAHRQSFAACMLAANPEGRMYYFSKENSSGGFIGTTDVFYPQLPHLLCTSLDLVKATLEPMCEYAASADWGRRFAPHDLGYYPLANGQKYRIDKTRYPDESNLMPVEECGNMLLCLGALAVKEGNADFAARWWPTVTGWAQYLDEIGVDPGNQLCTDDFAGHLAHNANLSVKTILALAAYAKMAEMRGDAAAASKYGMRAKTMVGEWLKLAADGRAGGYRLAFDQADSWSMKYNLAWDRILGFNLFPPEVAEREMAAYRALANPYGLALDSRLSYTKTDWELWCATLTGKRADQDFIVDLVYRYADETPDRTPLADWYWAEGGRYRGFRARSVIGGVFMPALAAAMCGPAKP